MTICRSAFLLFAALAAAFAQRTYDTYTFNEPSGYKLREAKDYLEYAKINQEKKYYCMLVLYRAQNSVGAGAQDLDNEWSQTLAKSFKTKGTPVTRDLPLPEAPASVVRGAEATDGNGNPAVVTLFLIRTPPRYAGIAFIAPNQAAVEACQPDAAGLISSVKMAASAPPTPPATAVPGTITGDWERVIASQIATHYNPFTKQWEYNPVAALNQFRNFYRWNFATNGEYVRELDAENFNRQERARVIERGRYTVSNGAIRLEPREEVEGKGKRGTDPPLTARKTPAPYSIRFTIGEHPQYKDSAGLQMQEPDGSWITFKLPRR